MSRLTAVLVAVLIALAPSLAHAQVVAPAGALPTRVPVGLDADPSNKNEPLRAFLAWRDPDFVLDPRKPDVPRPRGELPKEANLFARYWVAAVYDEPKPGGRRWYLLAETVDRSGADLTIREGGHLGWLPAEQVVPFPARTGSPLALKDAETKIYRKCMLVNSLDEAASVEALRAQVAFFDRPDDKGKERLKQALFTILYVFAETPTHFFVGSQPAAQDADALAGWVPRQRVCEWNTREALEFNKGTPRRRPALIFKQHGDLEAYLKARPTPSLRDLGPDGDFRPKPLAIEDLKVPAWKHDQARFPLVTDQDRALQGRELLGGYRAYKVGVIGDVYRNLAAPPVLTSRELEDARGQVADMIRQASTIQVLLVVDATQGMDRYFEAVRRAVRKIMVGLQGLGERGLQPTVQFSVNFYRDRKAPAVPAFVGNPFGDERAALDLLDEEKGLKPSGGGPPLDSVYFGVCKALEPDARQPVPAGQKSKFTPNAIKILILLGDDGNDDEDKEFTQDRVVEALREAGGPQPVGVFAVSVGDQKEPAYRALTEQCRQLGDRLLEAQREDLQKRYKDRLPEEIDRALRELTAQAVVSTSPDDVVAGIARRFDLARAELAVKRRLLKDLEAGVSRTAPEPAPAEAAGGYGVVWQAQVRAAIEARGLQKLYEAGEGVQLFQRGWVVERDPLEPVPEGAVEAPPAVAHVALVHREEMENTRVVLSNILKKWDPKKLERTWKEALDLLTGGDVTVRGGDVPAELLRTLQDGIAFRDTGLLRLTFDELRRKNPAEIHALKLELERKLNHLRDVLIEERADYSTEARGDEVVLKRTFVEKHLYWWGPDARSQRAWVDRKYLP